MNYLVINSFSDSFVHSHIGTLTSEHQGDYEEILNFAELLEPIATLNFAEIMRTSWKISQFRGISYLYSHK
jgi:hypothetical protein